MEQDNLYLLCKSKRLRLYSKDMSIEDGDGREYRKAWQIHLFRLKGVLDVSGKPHFTARKGGNSPTLSNPQPVRQY